MKLRSIIVLLSAAAIACGCESEDARHRSDDYRYGTVRSNEGYYGVIQSIQAGSAGNGGAAAVGPPAGAGAGREADNANAGPDVFYIRVRFDDRTFQTVTQASLDGLHVGDSVRIEDERVRHY